MKVTEALARGLLPYSAQRLPDGSLQISYMDANGTSLREWCERTHDGSGFGQQGEVLHLWRRACRDPPMQLHPVICFGALLLLILLGTRFLFHCASRPTKSRQEEGKEQGTGGNHNTLLL